MKLIYDRRSGKDRRATKQKESYPIHDSNGKTIEKNRRLKGDRRTEGLELSESDMDVDEFSKYFDQFENTDTLLVEKSANGSSEKWEINDYKVLHRKGVEFAYLTIIYKDQQEDTSPDLYAFRDDSESSNSENENKPTQVQNIHGVDAYQCYLEHGWDDITKSEETYPWAIKSWLAQHMKQDTIKVR